MRIRPVVMDTRSFSSQSRRSAGNKCDEIPFVVAGPDHGGERPPATAILIMAHGVNGGRPYGRTTNWIPLRISRL